MRQSTTLFAGLAVHKDSIDINLCDAGRGSEVRWRATLRGDRRPWSEEAPRRKHELSGTWSPLRRSPVAVVQADACMSVSQAWPKDTLR